MSTPVALDTQWSMALRNQVSRDLNDTANTRHAFIALLLAMDNFYGVKGTRFNVAEDTHGPYIQIDFRTGLPVVSGVSAQTGSLSSLQASAQSNFSMVGGTMQYSGYQVIEDIRKNFINRLKQDPKSAVPLIKKVAKAIVDGVIKKIDDDAFPAAAVTTSDAQTESKIMPVSYALLSGYANNAATGSGTYTYCGLDLNSASYTSIKALSPGNTTTPFGNPTPTNLRTKLLMPARNRGAKLDVGLCDSSTYDYMMGQGETKVVIEQQDNLDYGGTLIRYCGLNWVPIERWDQAAFTNAGNSRPLAVLDSSTWLFRHKDMLSAPSMNEPDRSPSLVTYQDYFEALLACENPRYNGLGWGVQV
jgi:hypothetical protein